MDTTDFRTNPLLQNIPLEKLELFTTLISQANGKTQKEMFPFLLAAAATARKKGVSFSQEEFQLIFEVLKQGKSEEEKAKMDQMVNLAKQKLQK